MAVFLPISLWCWIMAKRYQGSKLRYPRKVPHRQEIQSLCYLRNKFASSGMLLCQPIHTLVLVSNREFCQILPYSFYLILTFKKNTGKYNFFTLVSSYVKWGCLSQLLHRIVSLRNEKMYMKVLWNIYKLNVVEVGVLLSFDLVNTEKWLK